MNKGWIILGLLISFLFIVSALDFTPAGNINLRSVYNITNGLNATFINIHTTNITASYFKGDGSLLTGILGLNASFNQTLTDTLYSGIEWDYNQTAPAQTYSDNNFLKLSGGTMTGNVNFGASNITNIYAINFSADASHRVFSNGTCIIINGDTSTLNIC